MKNQETIKEENFSVKKTVKKIANKLHAYKNQQLVPKLIKEVDKQLKETNTYNIKDILNKRILTGEERELFDDCLTDYVAFVHAEMERSNQNPDFKEGMAQGLGACFLALSHQITYQKKFKELQVYK